MKDKIKEIIKLYKDDDIEYYNLVSDLGYDVLLDYIINLQEENEELKKNQRFHKKFGDDYIFCVEGDKETYKDYIFELQERIEKSIEYINNHPVNSCHELLDILQGVGKE